MNEAVSGAMEKPDKATHSRTENFLNDAREPLTRDSCIFYLGRKGYETLVILRSS